MPASERGFGAWDVVRLPFPYTNRPVVQRRPALVLLAPGAGPPGLLWVAMITSAANRRWSDDVDVTDLGAASLPAPSVVRLVKLATVEVEAADRLGVLATIDREPVRRLLLRYTEPMLMDLPRDADTLPR